ncbi:hypothetical protein BAY59_27745 [Prauserella coralliicola]|nr:hypothetical protein BAY59_27745 [Prauserella coralliicola]
MSPRKGGEADKVGNRYEAAWAIRHALYCILYESHSLTAEDIDAELGNGSEFTYTKPSGSEVHQLKRQSGSKNYWSIKALAALKVFDTATAHVAAGREYHFVSLIPCGPLRELAERARKSADMASFTQSWLTAKNLRTAFDELAAADIFGDPQVAWNTLRGMWFEVHGEEEVVRGNSMLAELSLEGASGHLIALTLGDILLSTLGKRLTRNELVDQLTKYGIHPLATGSRAASREQTRAVTQSWRSTVQRELLQPSIERPEAAQLIEALHINRLGLIVGTAGGGKSSTLEQAVETLEVSDAEVLAFRLDRLGSFGSTSELGRRLGLDTSPAAALALAADGRDAYLVIDQMDAVSLASGRMPESFDIIMDLLGEALSVANIRVILACRDFDLDNDHRIRKLAMRSDMGKIRLNMLPVEVVEATVEGMGLDPTQLTSEQRFLLRTPLHLVLLKSLSSQEDALSFQSTGSLFAAFWERKRQAAKLRRKEVRFNEVIARVANAASERQTLSVPIEILDQDDLIEDGNVLISEHVLARDGDRVAFFHESFFDYAFARQWVSGSDSLVAFLRSGEQELFRRAQIRQILQNLREREDERFIDETEAVLTSPDVRFHIKATVLAVLASLEAPTSEEASLVMRVAATKPRFENRLWQQLRSPQWFKRLHDDGVVVDWLDDIEQEPKQRAINFMVGGVKEHGRIVAELLDARQSAPNYSDWLRWIVRYADVHVDRKLFELVLTAVRQGVFDASTDLLWLAVHDLARHQPLWAIELLKAHLVDHVNALTFTDDGKIAGLDLREYSAIKLVRDASAAEPLAFVEAFVPYIRDVMTATALPHDDGPLRDKHFGIRLRETDRDDRKLGEALFAATARALEKLAKTTPSQAKPILQTLANDPYEASQFLLYRALIAGSATFADWAADLLLEGGRRLDYAYGFDGNSATHELVKSIAPHLGEDVHRRLEEQFRDLRDTYEDGRSMGSSAFAFLSNLEEGRLSLEGKRRLGEYRRKFRQNTPILRNGRINSPIGDVAASKMTDDQWLGAMAKYDTDSTNLDTLIGGAGELSQVLKERVAIEPTRFAQLAVRMSSVTHPAYGSAVLMGFGEAAATAEGRSLVFAAVRHIASFGHAANDRWLGMALRHHYQEVPLDLVELIRDRALYSIDPADDSPRFTYRDDDGNRAESIRMNGINTARGSLAEALGDLLIYDVDGRRTELVRPFLLALASDPVTSVRSCVAHTIAASLRYARSEALVAFQRLIDADDEILAVDLTQRLMRYIGNVNPEVIDPVIQRMLASPNEEVREAGGGLAAFAAMEWNRHHLIAQVLSADRWVRKGVAHVCANLVDHTSNANLATSSLMKLMHDEDDEVRKGVARVAPHLRKQHLRPFAALLAALIDSPSYDHATPQLLITLQYAPDKVDDLVLKATQRFLDIYGEEASDISTAASGDAHYISELIVRGLAQSRDRKHRAALLDVLDRLLELGVYGIEDAIAASERN